MAGSDTIRLDSIAGPPIGRISKSLGITYKEFQEVGKQILNQHGSNLRTLIEELELQSQDFEGLLKEGEEEKNIGMVEGIARIWRKKGREEITIKEAIGTFFILRAIEGRPLLLFLD